MSSYRTLLLDRMTEVVIPFGTFPSAPRGLFQSFECTSVFPLALEHFQHAHGLQTFPVIAQTSIYDIPPAAPPYQNVWYEWHEKGACSAVAIVTFDQQQITPDHFMCPEFLDPAGVVLWQHFIAGARWIQVLVPFIEAGNIVIQPTVTMIAVLEKDGRVLRTAYTYRGEFVSQLDDLTVPDTDIRLGDISVPASCHVALFFQGLLSCRNVLPEEINPPEKLSKKHVRRGGLLYLRYHTLRIRVPGTQRILSEDEIRRATQQKVLIGVHLRRGHFKTYLSERPLLGHAIGTFYWPPSLVGDMKTGVIGKIYKEIPGEFHG